MGNIDNMINESKCTSRLGLCAQKQRIPAPNTSFPEVFYSYSINSQDEKLNVEMKNRTKDIVEKCGCILTDFSRSLNGTTQYFCDAICLNIRRCALLIADVTPIDSRIASNIIYEIGFAQGLGKRVILVTCKKEIDLIETFISNLKAFKFFLYPDDFGNIFNIIQEILRNSLPEIHIISDASEFQRYCLRLEEKHFSRDFYSTIIPSMMRKDYLSMPLVIKRKIWPFIDDKIYTNQYVDLVNERKRNFIGILNSAKEGELKVIFRDIYIKEALRKYSEKGIMEGKVTPDNTDEVICRLEGLIHTLEEYFPHYEVGLLKDMEAPYKFLIKDGCGVVIDNPIRRSSRNALAIFSTIKSFVGENQSLFNKLWEMPDTEKKKVRVLRILKEFRQKAIEKRNREGRKGKHRAINP